MRLRTITFVCLWVFPGVSFADETNPPIDATALYDKALRAMDAKDYAKACPMLDKVVRAVPDGLGAKFSLAECHEESGRLTTAYEMFLLLEKETRAKGQTERKEKAAARAAALESRLARLTIVVPHGLASAFGIRVTLDERAIDAPKWGSAQFVDAGKHQILVEAKGGRQWVKQIEISDGEALEIAVRDIVGLPSRVTPTPGLQDTSISTHDEPAVPKTKASRGFPVWQLVTGGIGLAAVGAGVAFELDSRAAEKRLLDRCGEDLICKRDIGYDPGEDNVRKNRGFGLFVGFTSFGAAAIGAATIGTIVVRSGKKTPASGLTIIPVWSPASSGAIFSGRF